MANEIIDNIYKSMHFVGYLLEDFTLQKCAGHYVITYIVFM